MMNFYVEVDRKKNPFLYTKFYFRLKTLLTKKKPYFSKNKFLNNHQTAKILREEMLNNKAFHKRFDDYPLIQISSEYFVLKDIGKKLKKAADEEALNTLIHIDDVKWKE